VIFHEPPMISPRFRRVLACETRARLPKLPSSFRNGCLGRISSPRFKSADLPNIKDPPQARRGREGGTGRALFLSLARRDALKRGARAIIFAAAAQNAEPRARRARAYLAPPRPRPFTRALYIDRRGNQLLALTPRR